MMFDFLTGDDIEHDDGMDQLVIGYYTPDYYELAMAFANNCLSVDMNVRLFGVRLPEDGWHGATHLQPKIMRAASEAYPGRTLICMDVDCFILKRFAIDLMGANIACPVRVKVDRRRGRQYAFPSSRIIAIAGGDPQAIELLFAWESELSRTDLPKSLVGGNEPALMRALSRACVTLRPLPADLSAYEDHDAPEGATITHSSAHDTARPGLMRRKRLKALKRAVLSRLMGRDYRAWKYGNVSHETD